MAGCRGAPGHRDSGHPRAHADEHDGPLHAGRGCPARRAVWKAISFAGSASWSSQVRAKCRKCASNYAKLQRGGRDSNPSFSAPLDASETAPNAGKEAGSAIVSAPKPERVSVPVGAAELEAAIDKLTRAMAVVADEDVPGLVAERAALRAELRALQHALAGNVVQMSKSMGK
jgi:hypothetical protein